MCSLDFHHFLPFLERSSKATLAQCTLPHHFSYSLLCPASTATLSVFCRPEYGYGEVPDEIDTWDSISGQTWQWLTLPWASSASIHSTVTTQRWASKLLIHSTLRMGSSRYWGFSLGPSPVHCELGWQITGRGDLFPCLQLGHGAV